MGAILLAAGRSTRMGRPKLLLPWGESTILGHLISQWRAAGAQQILVVGAGTDERLAAELVRLSFPTGDLIINPDPNRGMFSSILCAAGVAVDRGMTHWAISLGDQPHLRSATLVQLIRFARGYPDRICQPACRGQRGHPVIMPKGLLGELQTSDCQNLKEFLARRTVELCECDDPGLNLDIDRPEDYARALSLAGLPARPL